MMKDFIGGEHKSTDIDKAVIRRANIVSQDVIFSPKSNNGLGLQRVSSFWSAIMMGWLHRLGHESFCKTLHLEYLNDKSLLFNPYKSNEFHIQKALKNLDNPVLWEIYISLLNCRASLIDLDPNASLFLPVFSESRTTKNNSPALSPWTIGQEP